MNFIEKIKLAFYNLAHRKKTTAQCVAMMSLIMILVFLSSFFISTLTLQLNDSLDNYASKNYIEIRQDTYKDFSQLDHVLLDSNMQKDFKEKFNSVGDINYYKTPRFYLQGNPVYFNWIIDGITYESKLTDSIHENTSYNYLIWWEIICKELNVPTFSKNMFTEFSKKFQNEELIKYGRDIQNDNEVLIPEEYLAFFDVTPEQLLNANVTIEKVFINAKVAGIINSNISMMYPDKNGNRDPYEGIYIYTGTGVLFYTNPYEELQSKVPEFRYADYTFQRIELKNSTQVESIIEYLESLFGEDYWIHYGNNSKLNELDTINKILTFVWDIIVILFFVLGVGLVVFLYSVMEHSAKQKGAYYGMMRAMGQSGTFSITLIETLIMTFFAAIICLIVSFATAYLMGGTMIYISWSSYEFFISWGLFFLILFLTLTIVTLINSILAFLSSKLQNSKSITAALRN